MNTYRNLAITNPDELLFGKAPNKVKCGNMLEIGGGKVFPEINFTLPTMLINDSTWKKVIEHYTEIIDSVLNRSKKLNIAGLVVEFEQLPPMTMKPEWGAEITKLLKEKLNNFYNSTSIPNALRVTVVDLRDAERPPLLREGKSWEATRDAFELSAQAGADILSIESVGGKEIHDQALMYGDIAGIVTSLGSLAWRDMCWLWEQITAIADKYNIVSGGDSAWGFSNTAMQLAGQGMLPTIVAAIDRAASAPRSLAAFENGAIGPSKDCAYEGPIIKAITGCPISMEGKSSCCAHFSPLGNIAGAMADLWSNESVQNIRLLSGSAPEAFMELLAYDCRLFDVANKKDPLQYRDMLVESDVPHSVEALMLEPKVVLEIATAIVNEDGGYKRTVAAVKTAFEAIKKAHQNKIIALPESEESWLVNLEQEIDSIHSDEGQALENLEAAHGGIYLPKAYGLA